MRRIKKALMIGVALVMLHSQMPACNAGQSGALVNPMEGITQNEPQIVSSKEISFGESTDSGAKSGIGKGIWLAVGVALIAGIVLGLASGGGGGESGQSVSPASGSGDVTFKW